MSITEPFARVKEIISEKYAPVKKFTSQGQVDVKLETTKKASPVQGLLIISGAILAIVAIFKKVDQKIE